MALIASCFDSGPVIPSRYFELTAIAVYFARPAATSNAKYKPNRCRGTPEQLGVTRLPLVRFLAYLRKVRKQRMQRSHTDMGYPRYVSAIKMRAASMVIRGYYLEPVNWYAAFYGKCVPLYLGFVVGA
jgi:hypothetical protein